MTATDQGQSTLPHRLAVLCYVYDDRGRVLLLHRSRDPNRGMYSPIGGKLDIDAGESPHDCALREIAEETGLELSLDDLHLTGIVAETGYEGQTHWLIFLFEVRGEVEPARIEQMHIDEGTLEWIEAERVPRIDIPLTDREVMWPLVQRHRGGFFVVHVDCTGPELAWTVQESVTARMTERAETEA